MLKSLKENHKEFKISNKLIIKTQQRFKRERHTVFFEEINKISLNSRDDKRTQKIDLLKTFAYRTSKDLISKKEEIKVTISENNTKND